jgi:hypothetical protein
MFRQVPRRKSLHLERNLPVNSVCHRPLRLLASMAFLLLQIPEARRAGVIAEAQRLQEFAEREQILLREMGMPANSRTRNLYDGPEAKFDNRAAHR